MKDFHGILWTMVSKNPSYKRNTILHSPQLNPLHVILVAVPDAEFAPSFPILYLRHFLWARVLLLRE